LILFCSTLDVFFCVLLIILLRECLSKI
jgi:hypothetical protein